MSDAPAAPPAAAPAPRGAALAIAALFLCAALWSLNGPLIKLLHQGGAGLDGLAIACWRSLLGGLFFLPIAWPQRRTLAAAPPFWTGMALLSFTLMTGCFVVASTLTAAANAIVLQYTAPLVVFVLAPFVLRERPRWDEGVALLAAMAGVFVVLQFQPASDARGLTIALLSGFWYGVLIVSLRRVRAVAPSVIVAMNFLGSGLLLLAAAALWGSLSIGPGQFALVALMSIVQFALPYQLFSWALGRVAAARAALITLLEMVLNPIWTWLAVGEAVPRATWIGGPLILAGVAGATLLAWRRAARATLERTPAA